MEYVLGGVRLTVLWVEDFVLLLSLFFHVFLESLFGVFELTADVVVDDVLVVVNVVLWSPDPDYKHGQCPNQEKYQDYACAYEHLVRDVISR